jgi:hypothetical protein
MIGWQRLHVAPLPTILVEQSNKLLAGFVLTTVLAYLTDNVVLLGCDIGSTAILAWCAYAESSIQNPDYFSSADSNIK